jgi:uncharacterized membrane protein YdbT with pleckstrin-like domain
MKEIIAFLLKSENDSILALILIVVIFLFLWLIFTPLLVKKFYKK